MTWDSTIVSQEEQTCLGISLARSGSDRLKDKCIQLVEGKEVFKYSLDSLQHSNVCDEIIVSTNDQKIVDLTREYGFAAFLRDPKYADQKRIEPIVRHTIIEWEKIRGQKYNQYVVIHGAMMFWRPSWIREAIKYVRTHLLNGYPITHVEAIAAPECCIVLNRLDNPLQRDNPFFLQHSGLSIDIDYPEDLKLARQVMTLINEGKIDWSLDEDIHTNRPDSLRRSGGEFNRTRTFHSVAQNLP